MTAVTEGAEIKEEGQVCLFLHKGNAHERSGQLKLSSEWRHQPRIHPQRSALLRNNLIADGFYNRLKSKQFIGWQNSQILGCYRKGRRWDYKRFPVILWNVFGVYAMNSEKHVSSAFVDSIQFPQSSCPNWDYPAVIKVSFYLSDKCVKSKRSGREQLLILRLSKLGSTRFLSLVV